MNLAYKKILGKFTKVLGFGKTPPHVGKNSQIISFFFFESVPYFHIRYYASAQTELNVRSLIIFVSNSQRSDSTATATARLIQLNTNLAT